ncbi:hypothetical protein [Spirosoma oryzicola]|uniref:hypothetical protein n=1 Tax=Spirosoma oryzicola TaxID=2898794 RepID=UPI001E340ED9|nr:hypothetical protein [Spirosoma oryzicola]UHG90787.1 hypothetical protein LQ777_21395 [Spirosoma oryzicola]
MKRYIYLLCLSVSLIGLSSCSKNNDPAPVSPVVGRWELNRGLLSGFPSSAGFNGEAIDLYYVETVGSTIDVYADNTFNENFRQVTVTDGGGTWAFNNNQLTLTYDAGGQATYNYSKNKNIEELAATAPVSYTVPVSTTANVTGQLQLIYRK